ncbi:MAG: lipoprotein insertase outer membrane protein LolB [Gammaproteobacteria bacterium]|nr:MAG: lipoprotein insertase outer membrane protein LolB [Gammaproteobacteria bacterium]
MSFVSGKIVNDNRAERRPYKSLLLVVVVLLGACTSKPIKKEAPPDWQSKQAALAEINSWKMHARIGLRGMGRSGSASLIWVETPEQRNLRLLGPLGGGLVLLQQDATGASIQDSKGRTWHGQDAGELIYRVTGWQIPVSGLRWWLLGLTEPGSKAESTVDAAHRLVSVQQASWKVSLEKYTLFGGHELPTSIVMETVASGEGERYIRIKVIVKDWTFRTRD